MLLMGSVPWDQSKLPAKEKAYDVRMQQKQFLEGNFEVLH